MGWEVMYKMVKQEPHILNLGIRPIDEARNGEVVRFVDRALARDRMNHWAGDDIRVDDGKVEAWIVRFHELPCPALGLGL